MLASVFAQEVSEADKELANQYMEQAELVMSATQALDLARDQYILAADLDPTNVEANYKAGDAIIRTVDKSRATKYFERVYATDPNFRFDILYKIGRSYQYALDFDNALKYYNRYKDKLLEENGYRGMDKVQLPELDRRIYESQNGKKLMINPAHYSIVNIGSAINTEDREYGPVLNENETEMVFTSRRREGNLNQNVANDNLPYEDIFISKKVDGVWQPAQNMGSVINTRYHDSNLAISADGSQLFLYSDENNGDIYTTQLSEDNVWTTPEPMSSNINSNFKESSVNLSPDGSLLFFASNRPSHVGDNENLDIYYSNKDRNGFWGRPKTVGKVINSAFNEDAPFMDYDGKTLYFSSDGRDGMGGYDIFRAVYDSAKKAWSEPVNIGYPINTPDDDVFFVSTKDGKRGYYASVREGGMGYTDIYMVTILKDEHIQDQLTSKDVGQIMTEPEKEEPKIHSLEMSLKKVKVGVPIVLRNVYFKFNQSEFTTESYPALNMLKKWLVNNASTRVEISGHTDTFGFSDYNKTLSQLRANAVVSYLVHEGIDRRRLVALGYGEEKPLASNDDEREGRELNRRVEFKILSR